MRFYIFLTTLLVLVARSSAAPRADCEIVITSVTPGPEPIVAVKNSVSGEYEFVYPSDAQFTVSIPSAAATIISCPGGSLQDKQGNNIASPGIEVKCKSGTVFTGTPDVDFSKIKCSENPNDRYTAKLTSKKCGDAKRGDEIEIGFQVTKSVFVKEITLCFDNVTKSTLYSSHNLVKAIQYSEKLPTEPGWRVALHDAKIKNAYNNQQSTINTLLGLPSGSTQYIDTSSTYFLSKGHLSAAGNFVYRAQKSNTYFFVNAAPQWQVFNGGNWNEIEQALRKNISDSKTTAPYYEIYVGTHEVATLPDKNNTQRALYLDPQNKLFPVPKWFWMAVKDPEKKKVIITFLGYNNPYDATIAKATKLCKTDISSEAATWASVWYKAREKVGLGYSYACPYDEIKKVIKDMPDIV